MKEEWREAVKEAYASNPELALVPVARVGLPMPARDPFDDELKRSQAAGGAPAPRAGKFLVEGKNVFVVRGFDNESGDGRVYLYDPAGHLIEQGVILSGAVSW